MAVPNMIVTLAMNASKYSSGLKKAAGQTTTFGSMATKAFDLAKGAMLGLTLAAIRYIPILANMGAESRRADIQLRFMLENMQGISAATDATIKRMDVYAQKVSLATAVDDEQIKAVQKKLLMFKLIRNSADEMGGAFDRATSAAIDLAAGGFGDMEANAVKLGRMLQSPITSLTAMNKAGVVFTDTEKKKIILLAESGDLLAAQDEILKKVEGRVKGLAEESATPWEKMNTALGQIGDSIGDALLDPLDDMNTKLKVWLASPQSKQDIQDITDAFVAMGEAAKFTLDIILNIKAGMDEISKFNKNLFGGVNFSGTVIVPRTPSTNGGNQSGPGGRPGGLHPGGNQSGPGGPARITVNFNKPVDSVSAGREISRVLKEYDRSNGGRRR
jgi:hypothetical protein